MQQRSRHELVWLKAQSWDRLIAQRPAADSELLAYWAEQRLPLVATRRAAGLPTDEIALGLPAPRRWDGRRLALSVGLDAVERAGRFPTLIEAIAALPADAARRLEAVAAVLGARAALVLVYGSHGWQALTRLDCLREGSDLDLLIPAPTAAEAMLFCCRLAAYAGALRIDGELLLPGGRAVAWREWHDAAQRGLPDVLVKHTDGAALQRCDALWPSAGKADAVGARPVAGGASWQPIAATAATAAASNGRIAAGGA